MTLPRRLVSLLLIYCFVAAAAPRPRLALPATNSVPWASGDLAGNNSTLNSAFDFLSSLFSPSRKSSQDDEDNADKEQGLRFHLSEAAGQPEARTLSKVANATPLSDEETQAILRRLPPLKSDPSDEADFALREKSLPPPRTGETIKQTFPPMSELPAPEQTAAGALEVIRHSPEGDVPIAPNLSVTFSQPMVVVSSQEEAAEFVPVKLSPQPPGKWHWIGTRTLLFEPDGRFPMATQYSVTVPGGTKSVNGGALSGVKTWTFTTPPPTVKTFFPARASVQRRDTLIFAEFDQRIDPTTVLRHIRVEAGSARITARLATAEEIERDSEIRTLAQHAEKGRWLAFRATDSAGKTENALPAGSSIDVSILPGTASAEGPRTSKEIQTFPFLTFGPLRVTKHECGYNRSCTPDDNWLVEFSNPLDATLFQDSQIKVQPRVEGLKSSIYDRTLYISGTKPGRTTYRVTLDSSIKDKFGQTLDTSATVGFAVGAAPPALFSAGGPFIVLDPAGPASIPVYTINYDRVRVRLYSVAPEDWPAWIYYQRNEQGYNDDQTRKQTTPPGRLLYSRIVAVSAKPEEMTETDIDLSEALKDGFGQMILIVEPEPPRARKNRYQRDSVEAWIQRTNIGLDAFVDRTDLLGWATSLKDGAPLGDIPITLLPYGIAGMSGADGMARIALPPQSPKLPPNLLVARSGNDVAVLPEQTSYWSGPGSWFRKDTSDALRWYVFDDRGLYRPGEEVHVKGWIRRVGVAKDGDVGTLNNAAGSVSYVLKDSRGNEITKGTQAVNALGGFDFALKLPPTMNLGYANIALKAEGGTGEATGRDFGHNFRVEEFRRPEFEVSAKTESEGPLFVGDHADASVTANYYAGGGLVNAEVTWRVTSTPGTFTPPNRGDFTFGKWIPWWEFNNERGQSHTETLTARTDASGKHRLRIDFDSVKPPRPSTVTAQATVMDVNRQAWTSTATTLVHPANLYVGLQSERTFVQQGEPLTVQSIVTDLDGKAIANREIKMRAVLLDWKQVKGEWKQVEVNPQDCPVQSATDAVKCMFASKEGGTYRVTATIHDDRGRANQSELTLWVAGGKRPPERDVTQEKVELIPDRKEYKAGDTAQILVQAPFYPAEAVMSLRRSGIVKTERFRIDGPTYTLRVVIEEAWTPNIHVQVDLVGAAEREVQSPRSNVQSQSAQPGRGTLDVGRSTDAKRPAFASGEINLSIPPLTRKLSVVATPRDKTLEPGGNTFINVEAKDAGGKPVSGGDVAVVVVDESVLVLTNYKLIDPITTFYAQRIGDATDYHLRKDVMLATLPGERSRITMGGGGAGGAGRAEGYASVMGLPLASARRAMTLDEAETVVVTKSSGTSNVVEEQIRLRENFNALAIFAPSVRTDTNGRAQVQVKLPDNLTRYRIMAVAVAGGKQFGSGESAITARLPLMARPSAPRFLNFGDRFELPIVLQNQTDNPMTVDVAVRATNASLVQSPTSKVQSPGSIESPISKVQGASADVGRSTLDIGQSIAGRRVTVPANDRVEVRIPAAAVKAGTARFQIGAVSGRWSDAAEIELPVWTPATTEAFATYGEIDEGRNQSTGQSAGECLSAIRRPGARDIFDATARADRRGALSHQLSVRVLGANGFAYHHDRRPARCTHGFQSEGSPVT